MHSPSPQNFLDNLITPIFLCFQCIEVAAALISHVNFLKVDCYFENTEKGKIVLYLASSLVLSLLEALFDPEILYSLDTDTDIRYEITILFCKLYSKVPEAFAVN